ncbi:MAG: twin-arginine translocase TatA/TatE family subunit [Streptosporangiales bacterium]|nr:twin-arginine translocase TatA/TatE family subunit [Streptosporangiales bacterium]
MPNLGTGEIIIIAVVILILFGAKKLPDAARAMGRSMRIFKAETKAMSDDDETLREQTGTEAKNEAKSGAEARPEPGAPAQQLPPGDGTTVNGVPVADPNRSNQPGR